MNFLRRLLARFDLNDAHFYAGMAMLFVGLWLTWSLGLALIVTGAVVAVVGFVSALLGVFAVVRSPHPQGGKR